MLTLIGIMLLGILGGFVLAFILWSVLVTLELIRTWLKGE